MVGSSCTCCVVGVVGCLRRKDSEIWCLEILGACTTVCPILLQTRCQDIPSNNHKDMIINVSTYYDNV